MDSPSDRVPERALERILVATKACGDGTPDLGYFLEVSVFIGGFGVENKLGVPRGVHEAHGRASGGGRPPPSWAPRDSSPITFCSNVFYIF